MTHAGRPDWSTRPQQKPEGEGTYGKGARCLRSFAVFILLCFMLTFFLLWSRPFVTAHVSALRGLIISYTSHVCHLHSPTPRNERNRPISGRTKERPLNFHNLISWILVVRRYVSLSYFCIVSSALAQTSFSFTQSLTSALLLWLKHAENVPTCSAWEGCFCVEDLGARKRQL